MLSKLSQYFTNIKSSKTNSVKDPILRQIKAEISKQDIRICLYEYPERAV